jgi:hypothetical protein
MTRPTMCYISEYGRLYTFGNITATVAAAAAVGIVSSYLISPSQSGRYGPARPGRQYGPPIAVQIPHIRSLSSSQSRAARRAVPAFYSLRPLWLYPVAIAQ